MHYIHHLQSELKLSMLSYAGHCHPLCYHHWPLLPQALWVSSPAVCTTPQERYASLLCAETALMHCSWDCHGLPVEHEIDKKLGEAQRPHVLACMQCPMP